MARKGSYRRKSRRHSRKHRGGNAPNPSSYSSASSYGMVVNGSGVVKGNVWDLIIEEIAFLVFFSK